MRIFLASIAQFNLNFGHMHVITAFLNGDLEDDIYIQVPAGSYEPLKLTQVSNFKRHYMV